MISPFRLQSAAIAALLLTAILPLPGQTASSQTAVSPAPPLEIHWNLIELDTEAEPVTAPEKQPYIYLQSEGDKLSGSAGCNHLFGSFDLDGSAIEFHSVRSTQMACPGVSAESETRLLEVLRLATSFQLTGNQLALKLDQRVLARFEAAR